MPEPTEAERGRQTMTQGELGAAHPAPQSRASPDAKATPPTGHAGSAWQAALAALFGRLKLPPRNVAQACTDLAKETPHDDPAVSLMLASLAQTLDPRPFRRKWYGFELYKAGLRHEALAVLKEVDGEIAFSPSETRVYAGLVRDLSTAVVKQLMPTPGLDGAPVPSGQAADGGASRRLRRTPPLRFEADIRGIGAISLSPVVTARSGTVSARSIVVNVTFLDEADRPMSIAHPDLSHSPDFPNYRYPAPGSDITLSIPEGCARLFVDFHRWDLSDELYVAVPLSVSLRSDVHAPRLQTWSVPGFSAPDPLPPPDAPTVLSILDEFSDFSFSHDLHLMRVTPSNWRSLLESTPADFLLVESAWSGNGGVWKYALTNHESQASRHLKELIAACKALNIPTVFWNKEDPPNFDWFIDTAKSFDVIFTTDVDIIPTYRERCGHDRVYVLPFFAQPRVHNPIGKVESAGNAIAFAGTWYARKHAERSSLAPALFDAALPRGLTIFNRRSDWSKDNSYDFPEKYRACVLPSIPYSQLLAAHKMFKIFLNVNSVVDSPTMFSRRVFEILASSTPVISTASLGIDRMFGDIVPTVENEGQAAQLLDKLLGDDVVRAKAGHRGYRHVMDNHTARHRIDFLTQKLGIPYAGRRKPRVTWAIATRRPEYLSDIVAKFRSQDYPNLEAIVALNSDSYDLDQVAQAFGHDDRVRIVRCPEQQSLGEVLNTTVDLMTGDYWIKVDDDDIHLEKFTSDMLMPFQYTTARVVGKKSFFTYLEETDEMILRFSGDHHRYVSLCSGATMAADRGVFQKIRFPAKSVGEDTDWLKACIAAGEEIYSTDIFNFIYMRRSDKTSHSWRAADDEIRRGAKKVSDGLAIELARA